MAAATVAAIGAGTALVGGLVSANQSKQAARGFANEAKRKEWELQELEKRRQAIPNPYANVEDLSGIAKDLSGMISNPFANLGVATQAAEIQIEEADISLANTLDTLRATGASAGGATALAQAALQSKRGVAASIEAQEAANEKLRAQGQAEMQQMRMAEAQRLQNIQFGEAQRMQQAEIEGTKFMFGEQEARDIARLNRLAGQQAQSQANQAAARQAQNAAYGSIATGIGNIGAAFVAGGKKGD